MLRAGWNLLAVYKCVRKDRRTMSQVRCLELVRSTRAFLKFWRQARNPP